MNLRGSLTAIALVTLALASVVATTWYGGRQDPSFDASVFATLRDSRFELHRGEKIRHVKLYPDGVTPKHAIADNDDDTITNYWYRMDGTLEKAITQSEADDTGARKLLRYAEIATDGLTYVYDVEYYPDGGKKKETKLVDAENVAREYFFEDGAIRRTQAIGIVNKRLALTQEKVFHPDGSVAELLQPLEDGGWDRKVFSPSGRVMVSKVLTPHRKQYLEVRYYDSGFTRALEIKQDSDGTLMTWRRTDDTKSEVREWRGPVNGDATLFVDRFDANGDRILRQSWSLYAKRPARLYMLEEYQPGEKLARSIYVPTDGGMILRIYREPGSTSELSDNYKYRPDGTLESAETASGKKVFSVSDNVRLAVNPDLLALHPAESPPYFVEYVYQDDCDS